MNFINQYVFILAPFFSWFLAQLLKPFFHYLSHREWQAKRMTTSSGMPSSHSSTMAALATIIALKQGVDTPQFAIAGVLALIVMYDAKGVRNASGKHAAYLNAVMDDINEFFQKGFQSERFKTELGHSTIQVFAGFVLGVVVACLFAYVTRSLT